MGMEYAQWNRLFYWHGLRTAPVQADTMGKDLVTMFAKTLFDQNIAPACEYCTHIARAADGSLHCAKKGTVQPFDHCRAFEYDPLRRVPRRRPQMPEYDPEEFML